MAFFNDYQEMQPVTLHIFYYHTNISRQYTSIIVKDWVKLVHQGTTSGINNNTRR